ncbi:MAG TPA: tetratricopeptide repeat protein [Polyangia bacterium]|jgi:Flp pilus assembly protein TadD
MRARLLPCLPALLAVVVYLDALGGSFHFDDAHAVVENASIRSVANTGRFFTDPATFSVLPQNQNYRPLLLVTYAATAAVTGVAPAPFIAVNLLVHVLCVVLLQAVLRRVLRLLGREDERLVLVAAALFAVHPIFSECVSYVSARSESLCAALSLAAILAYLRARDEGGWRWALAGAVAMAGAMLTKAVAVTVPLLVLLLEVAAATRQPWRRVLARLGWLLVPGVAGMVLVGRMTPALAVRSASSFTRAEYFRSELPALLHYVALFLWPAGQSADPHYPTAASFLEPRVLLAAAVLLAAVGFVAVSLARRRCAGAGLAVAWFLICILPSSSVFPLAEIVNEHRPYLAAAGLCPLLAAALLGLAPRLLRLDGAQARRAAVATAAAAIVVLGGLTVARNLVWRTEETLWRDVVAGAPQSARAQMNYGLALMGRGKMREAEPYLREAARLAPRYPYAQINLGLWLLDQGQPAEARQALDRALAFGPNLVYSHYYRGLAAERLGEAPAVRARHFAQAARLSPTHADAHYHLALALDAAGDAPGAARAARQAAALRGGYDDRFMLAYTLLKAGNPREAEPLLLRLKAERPGDPKVAHNLALAAKLRGR